MEKNTHSARLIAGRWISADPLSCIEHCIALENDEHGVVVIDLDDGELAEVYDVKWDGECLSYAAHWVSTGRFIKYSMIYLGEGRVGLNYTYSDQEILFKRTDEGATGAKA